MDGYRIRQANIEDCDAIMDLIKELAAYEKMPNGPKINAEVLRRDGFGEERLFRCIVAEVDCSGDRTLVGHALYFFSYSTWEGCSLYLEDLYVKPEFRGRGIGTAMWREVAKIAVKRNCVRMDWVCLNWNTSSVEYYKRKGAIDLTASEKWHLFRMKAKEIEAFASGDT